MLSLHRVLNCLTVQSSVRSPVRRLAGQTLWPPVESRSHVLELRR